MKFVWIPESPKYKGLYANNNGTDFENGKIQGLHKQPSTMSSNHALHFETEEQCQKWCDENPYPVFVPTQHGFGD